MLSADRLTTDAIIFRLPRRLSSRLTLKLVVSPARTSTSTANGLKSWLLDAHAVRPFGELNHEPILRLRSSPRLSVDEHRRIARLHAQRERAGARLSGARARSRRAAYPAAPGIPGYAGIARGTGCGSAIRPACSGVERVTDRVRRSRVVVDVLPQRAVARMINHDFVRAGHETQPLEHAVVVVDDARGEAVDEDLRFSRRHLQTQRDRTVAVMMPGGYPNTGDGYGYHWPKPK